MQIHRPSPFTAPLRGPTTAADTRVVVFNTGYGGGYAYDDGGDVVSDESRAHFSGVVALRAMVPSTQRVCLSVAWSGAAAVLSRVQ